MGAIMEGGGEGGRCCIKYILFLKSCFGLQYIFGFSIVHISVKHLFASHQATPVAQQTWRKTKNLNSLLGGIVLAFQNQRRELKLIE